jgi:hypothetical protein
MSSAPPNRSMVPLLSSMQEEKCTVLMSKSLQSWTLYPITKVSRPARRPPRIQPYNWLSDSCLAHVWGGSAAQEVLLSSFISGIFVPVLSFIPQEPTCFLQCTHSKMGLYTPYRPSLHASSSFKITNPSLRCQHRQHQQSIQANKPRWSATNIQTQTQKGGQKADCLNWDHRSYNYW